MVKPICFAVEIDYQVKLRPLLYRQVGWLSTFEALKQVLQLFWHLRWPDRLFL